MRGKRAMMVVDCIAGGGGGSEIGDWWYLYFLEDFAARPGLGVVSLCS